MTDHNDVPRDENGTVRTVANAFWTSVHQPELLEAVALENPREAGEGIFDYAERLAVEAGLMPISKDLRERNRLRYADRMPKDGAPAATRGISREVMEAGRRAEEERTRYRPPAPLPPYTPARQLPHEHDFENGRCECGARPPMRVEPPPVEPGDRIPDYTPVGGDDDEEWI